MIGTTLANYRVLEKLGEGGQGAVYKALDTKLGRTVVIKILPPELTAKPANLKRFEREARLASALDHPNICTIFDLKNVDGVHFIVMQYVEGRNVRQLVSGRPLELRSALSITAQVTDALAKAHSQGIIHRDIKAGNVMVTDSGQVKILDFGLAKLLDEDVARTSGIHHTELTELGVPYGTATYAAPEQARGDRVDHRADIFSTGVLLYEMLTGSWPFKGGTSIDVRHAVLHADPEPLATARPTPTPVKLQEILDKALAKDPRARYQKISEFREEIRGLLRDIASGTGLDMTESGTTFAPRHLDAAGSVSRAVRWFRSLTGKDAAGPSTPATSAPGEVHETPVTSLGDQEKKSLAILPFKNLGGDEALGFYEFSLADAVITELAKLRSLVVRPSSIIAKFQGQSKDPLEAGRELSVDAVLSAGFLQSGERIRVSAQLLDAKTGALLWGERIDSDASDIFAVQDTITKHIVDGLRLELTPDEMDEIAHRVTADPKAYEEYLRGRDCFGRFIFHTLSMDDCEAAIQHFKRAIELDPRLALAYSGLGACFANRVFKGMGAPGDYERAEEAFHTALELDPHVAEARMLMVFIYLSKGEKAKARSEVARLRKEAPNDAPVYFVKGMLHRLDGEYDRALRSFNRFERLDPAARVVASYNRARIHWYAGREDEAMRELDQASAIEPDHPLVKTFRARILYYMGRVQEARALLQEVLEKNPRMDGIRPILGMCFSSLGRHEDAIAQLKDEVFEMARTDHDIAYWVASVYSLEDKVDEAFRWLEKAIKLGNENRPWFETDPNLTNIRSDPRFNDLMSRIQHRSS